MPTVSLRLTEEQLDELRAWAHDGKRSLQKEIVWRLFSVEGGQATKMWPGAGVPRVEVETGETLDVQGVPATSTTGKISRPQVDAPDDHFKPDFKTERKPKK